MTTTKSVLATLLVLGSSTAAFARPTVRDHREAPKPVVVVRDHRAPAPAPAAHRDHDRDHDRDRGYGRDRGRDWGHGPVVVVRPPVVVTPAPVVVAPVIPSGWVTLTQPTAIANGAEQISLGAGYGRFGELQLVANAGGTYVSQVIVQFGNGNYQTIAVNQVLDPSNPSLTLDLKGGQRVIQNVTIEGSSGYGALYSIRAA